MPALVRLPDSLRLSRLGPKGNKLGDYAADHLSLERYQRAKVAAHARSTMEVVQSRRK